MKKMRKRESYTTESYYNEEENEKLPKQNKRIKTMKDRASAPVNS